MRANRDIARLRTCAHLLAQQRSVHLLSCGLTTAAVLALLLLLIMNANAILLLAMLAAMVLLGLLETVLAVRIGFDKALLLQLARKGSVVDVDLAELDEALSYFRLRPGHKAGRSLETRLAGSLGLFKRQAWVCGAQVIVLLCIVGFYALNSSI